ncbi:hypothetical protein RCL1_007287 [Eukaryota sp. TZLM3-RCL]
MDDLTLVGEPTEMEEAMAYFGSLAKEIGLCLNAKKCLIIVRNDSTKLFYEELEVPSINFNEDAVRLLGSFIGNSSKVQSLLEKQLEIFENELSMVSDFSIPKQLKFAFLRLCYSSKFNHIFRTCPPSLSLCFGQKYNSVRTKFIANLLNVSPDFIPSHAFSSFNYGGLGITKASILTKSAFLGGIRNFLYEFERRFPLISLINSPSPILREASNLIESLPNSLWSKLFPLDVEIMEKSIINLKFTVRKLQNKLKNLMESDSFLNKLSLAKERNVKLYNLLMENSSFNSVPSSSYLLSIVAKKFGLNLDDEDFLTCIRLRLNLDPGIILSNSLCLCGKPASFDHVVCCAHFNWCRTVIHNNVINVLDNACKSLGVVSNTEPVLNQLVHNNSQWKSKSRGDLHIEWSDSRELIIDATTVCFKSESNLKKSYTNAIDVLKVAEQLKVKKYSDSIKLLNQSRQKKLEFIPLAISLNGRFGSIAEDFFSKFELFVRSQGKRFYSSHLLKVRCVFALYKKMGTFIRKIALKLTQGSNDDCSP